MAKGNLFLGMARGSVGDVTLYRSNGEQIARARNRHPRNPQSDAQQFQRAIASTVVLAYKQGRAIFDHSFEGLQVPGGSQRRFLKVNMRVLREAILAYDGTQATPLVVSPSSVTTVPNEYIVSEGTLVQTLFSVEENEQSGILGAVIDSPVGDETVAAYCARHGLVSGDIFTVVAFGSSASGSTLISANSEFEFVRLILKDSALTATTLMSAANYGTLFEIDNSGRTIAETHELSVPIGMDLIMVDTKLTIGSMGVIRSRLNSELRSSTTMTVMRAAGESVEPGNIITAWSPSASAVDSPLILEGGDV